jgi:NAD(P)-dependent dehydrogenase (short-subunit alcohol dehydrogenase family)
VDHAIKSEFDSRVVVVSGADGGIGTSVVEQFAAAGAYVYATGIRDDDKERVAAGLGPRTTHLQLDVSREDHWQRVMAAVIARHGRLDLLVNNAGYLQPGLNLEDTSLPEWQRHFAVNADGVFLGCKHAILAMKGAGGGAIVNISSAIARRLQAESPAYSISKAAVLALTRVAAQHCGQRKYRIRVNAVLPGPIDTPMLRSNVATEEDFERLESMLIEKYAIERIGMPGDIVNAVMFLASERSSYISGAALTVDGGQSA